MLTQPLDLRTSARDFSKPSARFFGNPFGTFKATSIPKAGFTNSVRLTDLVKDGKIYLSLSDAIALALRADCPIYVAEPVLAIARLNPTGPPDNPTAKDLRDWLEGLNDEDLGRYKM